MKRYVNLSEKLATSIRTEESMITVRLYSTDIVKFNSQKIILNSGGWLTNTTKNRINQASNEYGLGIQVYQNKGQWYINKGGEEVEFYDGIEIER